MPSTKIHVYQKIADDLRAEIINCRILPGEILPSENELCLRYGASRETVRKGLKILDEEHLIFSRPRRGYFVAEPKQDELRLLLQEPSFVSERRFKDIQILNPSPEIRKALELKDDIKVLAMYKGTYSSGEMFSLEVTYIPYQKGHPSIEKEINFAVYPEAAKAKSASFDTYTKVSVTAVAAPEQVAKLMKCGQSEPLLLIRRTQFTQTGLRVSYREEYRKQPFGELTGISGYVSKE